MDAQSFKRKKKRKEEADFARGAERCNSRVTSGLWHELAASWHRLAASSLLSGGRGHTRVKGCGKMPDSRVILQCHEFVFFSFFPLLPINRTDESRLRVAVGKKARNVRQVAQSSYFCYDTRFETIS